jgi:hypothetical protein
LINENELTYGEFKLCSKLNKKNFEMRGFDYTRTNHFDLKRGKRKNELYYNHYVGLAFEYDDGYLQRVFIYFPRKDTTLKGIHPGSLRSEVLKAYGNPQSLTSNQEELCYGNLCFKISGDIVYGIELSNRGIKCKN